MDKPVPLPQALDPGFWTRTSWIQLGYGLWASMTQLGIGLALGFQNEVMAQLSAPNSAIKITNEEIAWSASVMSLSAPIGCLITGSLTDRIGRRRVLRICQLPLCFGWFYLGHAKTVSDIICGRIITGIGCGMSMFPPRIYAAETSLPNMRGTVGSLCDVGIAFGIAVQAVLGSYLHWTTMCNLCGVYALSMSIINCFIPETPFYILLTNDVSKLKACLAKFRSSTYNLDDEVNDLLEFKMDNNIRRLRVAEKLSWLMRRTACEPFGLISAYTILGELAGVSIFFMWTMEILTFSRSSVDPQIGNIILALTRLVVAIFTSFMLFRVGRRRMAITSALGVSVICFGLGSYLHFNVDLVPEVWLVAYVIFATLGYYTLPLMMMPELYTLQLRGFMGSITCSLLNLVRFSAVKYYPNVKRSVGFANSIYLFGSFSLICTLFLYFYLPETKSLTLQDIEEYFNARRPTLVSQRRVKFIQLKMSGKPAELSTSHMKKSSEMVKFSNKHISKEEESTSKGIKSNTNVNKTSEADKEEKAKKKPYVTASDGESFDSDDIISTTKKLSERETK